MQMFLQLCTLAIAVTNNDNGKVSDNANENNNSYKKEKLNFLSLLSEHE